MDVREIVQLQKSYQNLVVSKRLTKKAICDLVIPFRDRHGLTDVQALRIARSEMPLAEMLEVLGD